MRFGKPLTYRERERGGGRGGDRQTDTQTDTQTNRDRDRQRDRGRNVYFFAKILSSPYTLESQSCYTFSMITTHSHSH